MTGIGIPQRWALVSELDNNALSPGQLDQVAAAVDLQITRDLPTAWPVSGTVQSFANRKSVPAGYCVGTILDVAAMPQGDLGFHYDEHREPAAKIGFDSNDPSGVTTTVSHEIIEALVDPSGNRTEICTIVDPVAGHKMRVKVLIEAADAPEAYTYEIDGLPVSDFCLEAFYGPHRWKPGSVFSPGTKFSFCGNLIEPLKIAQGGYISYIRLDTGTWEQITWFGGAKPAIRTLGRRDLGERRSHREWIDSLTEELALPHVGSIPS